MRMVKPGPDTFPQSLPAVQTYERMQQAFPGSALPASVVFGLVYARVGALVAFGYAGVLAMLAMLVLSVKVQEKVRAA